MDLDVWVEDQLHEGTPRKELIAKLARALEGASGREEEEILWALDRLTGWCSPRHRL